MLAEKDIHADAVRWALCIVWLFGERVWRGGIAFVFSEDKTREKREGGIHRCRCTEKQAALGRRRRPQERRGGVDRGVCWGGGRGGMRAENGCRGMGRGGKLSLWFTKKGRQGIGGEG